VKKITLLGATGSIGQQTLDIIRLHPEEFAVFALTANKSVQAMVRDCVEFKPRYAVMRNIAAANELKQNLQEQGLNTEVLSGEQALCDVASHEDVDIVMAGIVGAGGLLSSLAAAKAGKTILLANKEALVMSGELFMRAVADNNATLLPVDSEHNAVFQCWQQAMNNEKNLDVAKIYITASGGPFLNWAIEKLAGITPEQAVSHPNWSMGQKISVDSATMMNKGLELIEAQYLFALPSEQVGILLHPQSLVHALVEYIDGSVLTHMGAPDMRVAISHALGWPKRIASGAPRLSLLETPGTLNFSPINEQQFPCLQLAKLARDEGACAHIILNAANEIAVSAFLHRKIRYTDIPRIISEVLEKQDRSKIGNVEDVIAVDAEARKLALTFAQTLQEPTVYV
jgi:1-deoxy-D-xylulose-5-phosphate reductoisomerase